jgi:DNA-binding FadR family transcriptional regulator
MIARGKLRDQVVTGLLDHIRRHGLQTGDALPSERELAAETGVSRTVVREALTALEMQGLLSLGPGRRPVLQRRHEKALGETLELALEGGADAIDQLMEVRQIVETAAAALAAVRATDDDIAAMRAAVDAMGSEIDQPAGYVDADLAFHEALLVATHNDMLVTIMRPAAGLLARSREMTTGSRRPPREAMVEHQAILERICSRDPEGARRLSRAHMEATADDLMASGRPSI